MKISSISIVFACALYTGCGTSQKTHEIKPRLTDTFSDKEATSPDVRDPKQTEEAIIGSAEMKADGTIVLQLRAALPDGSGDGYFVYPTTHPEYQNILKHVAPLEPGHSTFVRAWPEKKTEPNTSAMASPIALRAV